MPERKLISTETTLSVLKQLGVETLLLCCSQVYSGLAGDAVIGAPRPTGAAGVAHGATSGAATSVGVAGVAGAPGVVRAANAPKQAGAARRATAATIAHGAVGGAASGPTMPLPLGPHACSFGKHCKSAHSAVAMTRECIVDACRNRLHHMCASGYTGNDVLEGYTEADDYMCLGCAQADYRRHNGQREARQAPAATTQGGSTNKKQAVLIMMTTIVKVGFS